MHSTTFELLRFSHRHEGMTDGVAMLTKAKENLMFTMSALSAEQRVALSQSKHEFIEMCSFNGHQCDIDE
ncbi:hypothetical protein COOONC_22007 [Cooperia oncophora]